MPLNPPPRQQSPASLPESSQAPNPSHQPSRQSPVEARAVGQGRSKPANASNPFAREALAAKRAQVLDVLRNERGVSQPVSNGGTDSEVSSPSEATPSKPSEPAPSPTEPSPAPKNDPPPSDPNSSLHAEWIKREREIAAAESRVRDSKTDAEARSAKAEADEAKAKQALQELEWAKNEPVEFLAKVGMTKEEWTHFMSQGGKMSPEAKRLKAIEARFNEMEAKYTDLSRKAEESQRRALLESENAQFAQTLSGYALVSKLGGIQAVRARQSQMQKMHGTAVSMKAAADVLEQEMHDNLIPLLKHEDVRRKLSLQFPDQPSGEKAKASNPVNGKRETSPAPAEDSDSDPAPWDWEAKKRKARKLLDLARIQSAAL